MSTRTIRFAVGSTLVSLLGSAMLMAQTPSPTTSTSDPADASTPHQREATASASHEQSMKSCMDRQAKATPQASKTEMKKACDEQMKAEKEHLSKAHPAPKDSATSPAPR